MPLPVLAGQNGAAHSRSNTIAKSKAAKWRALALIAVQAIMVIHLLQWLYVGMTVSPVEPSESMETIQRGVINAGAVFFIIAIASTLVFGRFFCGWGCHVVALQDFCGHVMTKLGVRPKPFRTRLLVFIPLGIAIYMFIWPVISRQLVAMEPSLRPYLGEPARWVGWTSEFMVKDFWATFPPWYIAIPFLSICGFATVYFLGNKGFCTYGCPYGGFFGPADLVAPGKIRVTDACEGCGHCTAVCTSNVRVHEEVRDFGMVVDPGCMKCLDCVTVCPNDALYVGFGTPTILAKPRNEEAKARRKKMTGNYDLSRRAELICLVLFVALFVGYRGFMNETPLLMAVGIAAIGSFSTWKLWRLALDQHVRLQNVQLKHKGRMKVAGFAFVAFVLLLLAGGAWGATVKWTLWRAAQWDDLVTVPRDTAFSGQFTPDEATGTAAANALRLYERAGPFWNDGTSPGTTAIGWSIPPVRHVRMAYLNMVIGKREAAERHMIAAVESGKVRDELVAALVQLMELRGADEATTIKVYSDALTRQSTLHDVRLLLASYYANYKKQPEEARKLYETALADRSLRWSARVRRDAAAVFINTGDLERGIKLLDEAVDLAHSPGVHEAQTLRDAAKTYHDLAAVDASQARSDNAITRMTRAAEIDESNPMYADRLAELLTAAGKQADAAKWTTEAKRRNDAIKSPER